MITVLYGTNNDDNITAGAGNHWIFGLGGNDTLWGGNGDDYLNGGDGDDELRDFAGNDYLYGGAGNDLLVATGYGSKTLVGGDGDDELVLNVGGTGHQVYGGNGNDYILVDSIFDGTSAYISGGNGDDYILRRGDSDDTISGGAGNDTILIIDDGLLRGGTGNDTYFVSYLSISTVTIVEYGNEGVDEVRSERTFTLDNHLENLTLLSETSDIWHDAGETLPELDFSGYGNNLDNTITGNIGANVLAGYGGNDTLDGKDGNDRLIGGADTDSLLGGKGDDILIGTDDFNVFGATNRGIGSIDELTGGTGRDRFVLGQSGHVFYDDSSSNGFGKDGYALITDFKDSLDTIQLWGKASDYILGSASVFGISGTALYLKTPNIFADELIAIVKGSSNLDLHGSYFDYMK